MFTFLFITHIHHLASLLSQGLHYVTQKLMVCILACLCPHLLPPSVWLPGLPALSWPAEQEPASGPLHVLWLQHSSFPGHQHESLMLVFWLWWGWALSPYAYFLSMFYILCNVCSCLLPIFSRRNFFVNVFQTTNFCQCVIKGVWGCLFFFFMGSFIK